MSNTIHEEIMTSDEAEVYLRLAKGTLKTWRYQGKGPDYAKSGNFVRYLKSDLDFWLDAMKKGVTL